MRGQVLCVTWHWKTLLSCFTKSTKKETKAGRLTRHNYTPLYTRIRPKDNSSVWCGIFVVETWTGKLWNVDWQPFWLTYRVSIKNCVFFQIYCNPSCRMMDEIANFSIKHIMQSYVKPDFSPNSDESSQRHQSKHTGIRRDNSSV